MKGLDENLGTNLTNGILPDYRNDPSNAGPTRNKHERRKWKHKKPEDEGNNGSEIRDFLRGKPRQVIPLDLDDIKPGATLLETLNDQLRYCDYKDMLTIEWLLKVAPEKIVLVVMGNGRYSYQSKHIERVIRGVDHKEVTKVFTSTHSDQNNKV